MPGFFEVVTATYVYNMTDNRLQTIYDFKQEIINEIGPAPSGPFTVLFNDTDNASLFNNNHVQNTDGPNTAGWNAGVGSSTRDFDMGSYSQVPSTATGVILLVAVSLKANDLSSVGFPYTCYCKAFNPGASYTLNSGLTVSSLASKQADHYDNMIHRQHVFVPIASGQKTVRFTAAWPNVGVNADGINVQARLVGYVK